MNDAELLHRFVSEDSEDAFRDLVDRYLPLVYSAALRQVGRTDMAEDVTQVVFITLARKAPQMSRKTLLPGWLFRTTRHTAAKALRSEQRRRHRETEATRMQTMNSEDAWERTAPLLDDALAQLNESERGAVLLRFFQNRRLRDVGLALGMTEDAAQKRIARAVTKLRRIFLKRGVALPEAALPGLLMTHGALPAPSYLGPKVCAAAMNKLMLAGPVEDFARNAFARVSWPKVALNGLRLSLAGVFLAGLIYLLLGWVHATKPATTDYAFDSSIAFRGSYSRPVTQATATPSPAPIKHSRPAAASIAPPPAPALPPWVTPMPIATNSEAPFYSVLAPPPPNADYGIPAAFPGQPAAESAGGGGAEGYGVSLHVHGQGPIPNLSQPYWPLPLYTNTSSWMPAQRSPSIIVRGRVTPGATRKKNY